MTEWRECKLKDVCKYERISINPQKYKILQFVHYSFPAFDNNKTPEIQFGGQIKSSKYIVKKGYILYNKLNVRFKRIWNINFETPENSICSSEFLPILAKKCNQDYLYYFLCSDELTDTMANSNTGTSGSHQRIDPNFLMKYDILLPPLPEQKAIAEVLSSLDDKIDLLTRQNKTLEDLAQAYFRKWFIEDIHNKICYKRFADVAEFSKGKKPREIIEEQRKGYVRQILIDTFDTDKEYYTRPEGMIISTETDILMVMDGASSGRVEIGFSGVVGSTIGMFRPKSDFKYPMFLYEFLKSNEEFIMDNTTGSAIPHADKKLIFELEIPYFQEEKIQEFENFALVLFNKRQNNRRQIRTLTKLRDTLLPKLISGEIRVKM